MNWNSEGGIGGMSGFEDSIGSISRVRMIPVDRSDWDSVVQSKSYESQSWRPIDRVTSDPRQDYAENCTMI